jgi:hypothetical protein
LFTAASEYLIACVAGRRPFIPMPALSRTFQVDLGASLRIIIRRDYFRETIISNKMGTSLKQRIRQIRKNVGNVIILRCHVVIEKMQNK